MADRGHTLTRSRENKTNSERKGSEGRGDGQMGEGDQRVKITGTTPTDTGGAPASEPTTNQSLSDSRKGRGRTGGWVGKYKGGRFGREIQANPAGRTGQAV